MRLNYSKIRDERPCRCGRSMRQGQLVVRLAGNAERMHLRCAYKLLRAMRRDQLRDINDTIQRLRRRHPSVAIPDALRKDKTCVL